jgi:hypothetical protein
MPTISADRPHNPSPWLPGSHNLVGREGSTMASRQELGDQNSTELGHRNSTQTGDNEEQKRVFALCELCSLFWVFFFLLLCTTESKHVYN